MLLSPRNPVDPNLADLFASRGKLDAHRYLETRDVHDLENAISNMRSAISLTKDTQSAILGPALGNLAALLLEQFRSTRKDIVLNEARQLSTWALECLSDFDANRAQVLATLGTILTSQYDRSGRTLDLEEAITSLYTATRVRSLPDNSTFPAVVLNNLSCVLEKRYENTGRREDLNDAVTSALEATEASLLNHPSLSAGVGLNLASLLLRQYKATENLDSLANALFELRIVTEVSSQDSKLDTLLGHLGSLAIEQHALRAPQMDQEKEMSQSHYPTSLTLYLFLSLSTTVFVFLPMAFYPSVLFFGGIVTSRAFQQYYQQVTKRDKGRYLLYLIPTWAQEIFLSQYDSIDFTPTLFPAPWIDISPALILPKSEEQPDRTDISREKMPIHATRLQSEYDEGRENWARNRSPAPDSVSAIKRYTSESKNQPLYDIADSKIWEDLNDSLSDSGPSRTLRSASEKEKVLNHFNDITGYDPKILTRRISMAEDVPETDIAYPVKSTEYLEQQERISDTMPISVGHPSKQAVTEAVLPRDGEDSMIYSNKQARSVRDRQATEDSHSTLGKDFIDKKVHSRVSPVQLEKESSAFDSVAQGNTSNDINKNEGNAMGNIYSEQAHVVGRLSRQYGNRFETKNISAVLPRHKSSDANQSLSATTLDETDAEDTPQEIINLKPEFESRVSELQRQLRRHQRHISVLEHKQDDASKDDLKYEKERAAKISEELRDHLEIAKTQLLLSRARRETGMDSKDQLFHGRSAEAKTVRGINQPAEFDVKELSPPNSIYGETNSQTSPDYYLIRPAHPLTYETLKRHSEPIAPVQGESGAKRNLSVQVGTVSTSMPPSAPNLKNFKTSREQVDALWSYFRRDLLPLCNYYIRFVPVTQNVRDVEHRKLSETILSQVLVNADGINILDEPTRKSRHRLVDEAQETLNRLDSAALSGPGMVTYIEDIVDD